MTKMQYGNDSDIIYIMPRPVESGGRTRAPAVRLLCCLVGMAAIISTCAISLADGLGIGLPFASTISTEQYGNSVPDAQNLSDDPSGAVVLEAPNGAAETSPTIPKDNTSQSSEQTSAPESESLPAEKPESSHAIIPVDLSRDPHGEILIDNSSGYDPDVSALLGAVRVSAVTETTIPRANVTVTTDGSNVVYSADGKAPAVLIVHTHGTECYSTYSDRYLDSEIGFRDHNTEHNMIAVGSAAANALAERGISVLHCTIMHDAESYNDSYNNSAKAIRELTEKYPSISYVLDLHRDAVQYEDGSIARPIIETELGPTAQLMLVIGTNAMGANHPNWQSNLSLGLKLQTALNDRYPNIARPISLRGAAYNQQYTPGSLLVEVGACGNTLAEAERAAVLLADALTTVILSG